VVVVYQILYSDISTHLAEYATLKAMGYSDGYLLGVVLQEALILSLLGFLPGLVLTKLLFVYATSATMLTMQMVPREVGLVYLMTAGICTLSGMLAVRRLKQADPASIFK